MDLVTGFALPLVAGGTLHVGRPVRRRRIAELLREVLEGEVPEDAVQKLQAQRHAIAAGLLPGAAPPPLDERTLRLAAAVHNILAMLHPALRAGSTSSLARVAGEAEVLADLPPPRSEQECVERHSLLSRLHEVKRRDWTVHLWFGSRTIIGRRPPKRLTALPWLRRVRLDSVERSWLDDLGVPAPGRAAHMTLCAADPLGEAMHPLRSDPPVSWPRMLPALRFPALARVAAARAIELGLGRAGSALAMALLRLPEESRHAPGSPAAAEEIGFAVRFLAHLVWMDQLFGRPEKEAAGGRAPGTPLALATVMAAAAEVDPGLVWPADVSPLGDLGRAFAGRLRVLQLEAMRAPDDLQVARQLCRSAAAS